MCNTTDNKKLVSIKNVVNTYLDFMNTFLTRMDSNKLELLYK